MDIPTLSDIADEKDTPPVRHSMPVDAIPRYETKGSTSLGGASLPSRPYKGKFAKFDKAQLKLSTQELSCRLTTWLLEGDRLETMLKDTKLKDIMIAFGITTEKLLLLEGQPTSIIGTSQQVKLDELFTKLGEEARRRKLVVIQEHTA